MTIFRLVDVFELESTDVIFLRGDILEGTVEIGDTVTAKNSSESIVALESSDSELGSHLCIGISVRQDPEKRKFWLAVTNEQVAIYSATKGT